MKTLRKYLHPSLVRAFGVILLGILLVRFDLKLVVETLLKVDPTLVLLTIVLIFPLIATKTLRWWGILQAQAIDLRLGSALLAYFASLFIGFLTPGRLGEFSRAFYVLEEHRVPSAVAISSVLADRLFDLYALLLMGGAALFSLHSREYQLYLFLAIFLVLSLLFLLFLNDRFFRWLQTFLSKFGWLGRKLLAPGAWLIELRSGLKRLTWSWFLASTGLTAAAYFIFFGQCYLLAKASNLPVGVLPISYAIALGSLVTLLPISISGLGTREVAITVYLGTVGISAEASLSYSLLVFAIFYLVGGIIGALAWWLKPISLDSLRSPVE